MQNSDTKKNEMHSFFQTNSKLLGMIDPFGISLIQDETHNRETLLNGKYSALILLSLFNGITGKSTKERSDSIAGAYRTFYKLLEINLIRYIKILFHKIKKIEKRYRTNAIVASIPQYFVEISPRVDKIYLKLINPKEKLALKDIEEYIDSAAFLTNTLDKLNERENAFKKFRKDKMSEIVTENFFRYLIFGVAGGALIYFLSNWISLLFKK